MRHAAKARSASVLCRVHWRRLVFDEGHVLGGGALTNAKVLLEACWEEPDEWLYLDAGGIPDWEKVRPSFQTWKAQSGRR